jgi:hypothetical protein
LEAFCGLSLRHLITTIMHLIGWAAYLVVELPEFASAIHIHRRVTNQAIDIYILSRREFAHGLRYQNLL